MELPFNVSFFVEELRITIKIQHLETNTIEDKKRIYLKFKSLLEKRKK